MLPETEPSVAVIVTVPGFSPDIWFPDGLKLAIDVSDESQVTRELRLSVLPLLKVPVAVSRVFVPWAIVLLPFTFWMEIEVRLLASTVSEALLLTDSKAAEIVVEPMFLALTKPLTVTEATEVDVEAQFATLVTSCVVPSLNVAVAVNC